MKGTNPSAITLHYRSVQYDCNCLRRMLLILSTDQICFSPQKQHTKVLSWTSFAGHLRSL